VATCSADVEATRLSAHASLLSAWSTFTRAAFARATLARTAFARATHARTTLARTTLARATHARATHAALPSITLHLVDQGSQVLAVEALTRRVADRLTDPLLDGAPGGLDATRHPAGLGLDILACLRLDRLASSLPHLVALGLDLPGMGGQQRQPGSQGRHPPPLVTS
jgi:hypothetical protein